MHRIVVQTVNPLCEYLPPVITQSAGYGCVAFCVLYLFYGIALLGFTASATTAAGTVLLADA